MMCRTFIRSLVALLRGVFACLCQAVRRYTVRKSLQTWKMLFAYGHVLFKQTCSVVNLQQFHLFCLKMMMRGLLCLPAECFHIAVYCRLPLVIPVLCEWELDRGYLGCVAPGSVIKFTDEISERLREWRPKPGELRQKVLSSTFCQFLPLTQT